jgi:hypothetical protein
MTAPRILAPAGAGRFVLFCDHASNYIPAELHDLGLPASELARHIAWDIGAAGVTEALSEIFDAPAILCSTSRLVIDCNRHLDAADLIPEVSDGTAIPATCISARQPERPASNAGSVRITTRSNRSCWNARREACHLIAVSIHSMTASLAGKPRPWQIALSSHLDRRLADPCSLPCGPARRRDLWGTINPTIWIRRWTTAFHSMPCAGDCRTSRWNSGRTRYRTRPDPAPMGSAFRSGVEQLQSDSEASASADPGHGL